VLQRLCEGELNGMSFATAYRYMKLHESFSRDGWTALPHGEKRDFLHATAIT
jgi:hypothetical protein